MRSEELGSSSRSSVGRRIILGLFACAYLMAYLFVVGVACITNGNDLIREPWAWYAFLAPVIYAAFCALYACGIIGPRVSQNVLLAIHILVLPALALSFLMLGLLLPILAWLWWRLHSSLQMPAV